MGDPMIRAIARIAIVVLSLALGTLGVGVTASAASDDVGYLRLAHLSPDTPKVDVYVASFGNDDEPTVLRSVGYGAFSPYQGVPAGSYTIAMRLEGAPASEPPVLSTTIQLEAHTAATVVGMGKNTELALVTITDGMELPGTGKTKVRVIQAAMSVPAVDSVEVAGSEVASDLAFTEYTNYSDVTAGTTTVKASAGSETAEQSADLVAGGTYTVVVQDVESGISVLPIQDFAAANEIPTGGVEAGLGGSAGGLADSWALVALALAVAAIAGLAVTRQPRAGSR
jgi:Domain of unknown function (DUF4397)